MGRWELAGREMGRGILPQEMGHPRETNLPHDMGLPRPELAGTETRRRIYRGRCDIQGWNWQVGRWEEEFSTWHGTSKAGMGLPRPELAGWEETCTTGGGNWQVGRWEEEFSTGERKRKWGRSEVEVLEPACLGGDTTGEHKGETQRGTKLKIRKRKK